MCNMLLHIIIIIIPLIVKYWRSGASRSTTWWVCLSLWTTTCPLFRSWPHRTDEEYLWHQAVDLPQFPFPPHLKCRLTSFFFLYLHTPLNGIPLCHIHAVTHLGAARCHHNRTTGRWAAPLERLGIKCFAQGQLVIFERRESISYSFSTPSVTKSLLKTLHSYLLHSILSHSRWIWCICGLDRGCHQHRERHVQEPP